MEEKHPSPDLEPEIVHTPGEVRKKPEKKRKWVLIPAAILLLLVCGFLFLRANDFRLELQLTGGEELLLEYGKPYQDPGAAVLLKGKWLLKEGITPEGVELTVDTDLDENTLGKYTVSYYATYQGLEATASRTVRVADMASPLLTLKTTGKTILPGRPYDEEGYVAVDNYDGNLTDKVVRREEMGKIIYTVMDSSGNPAYAEREIPYYDPEAPELTLEGREEITIPCGTVFTEPGFTATDNADGDLTAEVALEGAVTWYEPGTYQLAYTVADTFGNVTQKIRTVTVEAQAQPEVVYPNGRVIYLTFDDGPGPYTGRLLDVLKKYGVKATFFVTNSGYDGTMWRIVNEGHSIGIHTMTHDYNTIYASEEAFFNDLLGMQEIIYRNTGVKTTLMRFPGGGSNVVSRFNEGIMTRLTQAVQDAGFQYFDWNVDSNDAGGARKKDTVSANVIGGVQNQRVSIVLQHDIHDFSVEAVEDIIIWGLNNGYKFLPLKQNSPTMQHDVLN